MHPGSSGDRPHSWFNGGGVGFVNMLSDGADRVHPLAGGSAWIPGAGHRRELMRWILDGTDLFYSVDLVCDAPLVPYYERFGMRGASSALLRHPAALAGCLRAGP